MEVSIHEPYFTYIKKGQKSIECRIAKDDLCSIKPGMNLKIENSSNYMKRIHTQVIRVEYYKTFSEMLRNEMFERVYPNIKDIQTCRDEFYKYNLKEDEEKYGVVAIVFV
jgi:ASC-1-like (ASCH) protein